MKRMDRKSDCAINFSLENFGDPWSLLIVRDIFYHGKRTYGEFLASDERIGTSVLARRLAALEKSGVLLRIPNEQDKRTIEYQLTQKGLHLIPVLEALTAWGATYDPDTSADPKWKLVTEA
jgi:DNA-binding HxlR family transcriptional regulator